MLKIGVWMFEEGDNDGLRHILGMYDIIYNILAIYQFTDISYRTSRPLYTSPDHYSCFSIDLQ